MPKVFNICTEPHRESQRKVAIRYPGHKVHKFMAIFKFKGLPNVFDALRTLSHTCSEAKCERVDLPNALGRSRLQEYLRLQTLLATCDTNYDEYPLVLLLHESEADHLPPHV